MISIPARATHYMTFPHNNAGKTRSLWTTVLTKNGERVQDVPIEVREITTQTYTFTFQNDGDDEATWTLIVWQTDQPEFKYEETWFVKKKIIEQNVKHIRSRQDSEGGFFKSSYSESE